MDKHKSPNPKSGSVGCTPQDLARHAIDNILDGHPPNDIQPDQLGKYGECYAEMKLAYEQGGTDAARLVYTTYADHDYEIAALRAADPEPERHPLDINPKETLDLGWIDQYTTIMSQLTGSPPEFNRLAALVTVATAIQHRAYLRLTFATIRPNIYGVIIAHSSVYHKSGAIRKPRTLLEKAGLEKTILSELFTSEGLLKKLSQQEAGLVLRDEIGTLFDSRRAPKYLQTLKPDLTALYDGDPYSRVLSGSEINVKAPYLNILGATTPARFFDGVTHMDWQDGFMARWLFVTPTGEPSFETENAWQPNYDLHIDELSEPLRKIQHQPAKGFVPEAEAMQYWNRWQADSMREAYYYSEDDTVSAIVSRYNTYALKFALILASINNQWGAITVETMQTAIGLTEQFKRNVYRLLQEQNLHGISGAKLQKIFTIIQQKNQGEGLTKRAIMQFVHMTATHLNPCIDKLLEVGAIASYQSGKTTKYIAVTDKLPIKSWK